LTHTTKAHAGEIFEIELGEHVRVISDQAFRITSENTFEAVGNVIITHLSNSIYGEKATLSFETGEAEVVGNVRYVGPAMTLHGSQLSYNFKTGHLTANNSRIISDNYTLLATRIERPEPGVILAEEAEYTTCRDCPESWSVHGRRVRILLGEYIFINQAYLKVKGVVMMYTPYIVFPIKKERETGFLFPSLGFKINEGARFQMPWFWAISDSADMTLSPALWGKRGLLNQAEYRQVLGEGKWFSVNSLQSLDRIYEPYKWEFSPAKETTFRHFTTYEHHVSSGNWFNHHFYGNHARDLDMVRDFEAFKEIRPISPEMGAYTFFNFRLPTFDVNIESQLYQNQLVSDPRAFDHDYVQILPRLTITQSPVQLLQTDIPLFRRLSFGGEYEYTYFTQNHFNEQERIRNAHRVNLAPFLDLQLGYIGPIKAQTRATLDFQSYNFPYEDERRFTKRGILHESELSIELERIFGLAYRDTIPFSQVDLGRLEKQLPEARERGEIERVRSMNTELIGDFPEDLYQVDDVSITVAQNSYRHSQIFALKHYYLGEQAVKGNERFLEQIQQGGGQFDILDAIRQQESLVDDGVSRTRLPLGNTLELQWNNSLIRKTSRNVDPFRDQLGLRDSFRYSRTAYFNLSQGLDLTVDSEEELKNRLTRFHLDTGFSLGNFSFRFSEYYFWASDKHLFRARARHDFGRLRLTGGMNYNAFSRPINKTLVSGIDFLPNDLIALRATYDYDLERKLTNRSIYGITYKPTNNCWMLDLSYASTRIDKSVSFNILINFNDNTFTSFGDR
jgi:LPS-assembly protein